MRRSVGKIVGGALALLCLTSTLALAQGEPQILTCMKDDGKGVCTAATTADHRDVLVFGPGVQRGDTMSCVDRGYVVDCRSALR